MVTTCNWLGLLFIILLLGILSVVATPSEDTVKLRRAALEWSIVSLMVTLV